MNKWTAIAISIFLLPTPAAFAVDEQPAPTPPVAALQPTWQAVDSTGAAIAEVYFLHAEALLYPSHYSTPYVLVDLRTGISPQSAGLYALPIGERGYTNVDGVGSPIGNAFAYTTSDCSDTPVVDTRVIPWLRSSRAGTRAGFVMPIATPPNQARRHQLWRPVGGEVLLPLVAQRFEIDGPCFEWAPYVGPEDQEFLSFAHFETVLPPVDDPIHFESLAPPASGNE
jgi:hypothetical protein